MRNRPARMRIVIALFVLGYVSSPAWTPMTRGFMAVTAYRAFPEDLRLALRPHRKVFRDAALATDIPADPAGLTNEACRLLDCLSAQLSGKPKFRRIAANLGRLAAVIAQMTDPFLKRNDAIAKDYRAYVERKLHRFRFAYQPLTAEELTPPDLCTHLFRFRRHGTGMRATILTDYRSFGYSARFDDRSGAFGAASILFADGCLEIARAATLLWKSANGRISDSPLVR